MCIAKYMNTVFATCHVNPKTLNQHTYTKLYAIACGPAPPRKWILDPPLPK